MKNLKAIVAVLLFLFLAPAAAFTYFGVWDQVLSNPQTPFLPYFVLRSVIRMLIAYVFVVAFGLTYGIVAGLYRTARIFMLPVLDIMQAIPVLGYLPAAILLFSGLLPGELGYEIASVVLIFTGMAWAVAFSVLGAVRHLIYFMDGLDAKYGERLDAAVGWVGKTYGRTLRFLMHIPARRRQFHSPALFSFSIYLAAFLLIMLLLAYFVATGFSALPLRSFLHAISTHPEVYQLPVLAAFSAGRILIAYIIALCWTLVAGIAVARNKTLNAIFMPAFDVGQSTPALALFPFIVIIVIHFLGGTPLSIEVASIVLLLTGTQWYLLFNIVGAVKSIPGNILEASRAFNLKGANFYLMVLLPAIIPGVLLGSIQAWGGAWNALIVSEYITYQGTVYTVPGLGAFLTQATKAAVPEPWVITLIIATMSLIVLLMNYLIWRPLFNYAERYRFENV